MSRVCSIHEQYCPDDTCRWCESPEAEADGFIVLDVNKTEGVVTFASAPAGLGVIAPPAHYWAGWPGVLLPSPLPIATCKHDGNLYVYGDVTSCAICGKILKP